MIFNQSIGNFGFIIFYKLNLRHFKLFALLLFSIFSLNSFSINKKNIKTLFNDAEWYFMEGDYANARELYAKLVETNQNNSNYNYKLGVAILFDNNINNDSLAERYLAVAVKHTSVNYKNSYKETAAPIDAFVFYGDILRYNYKFDEAIKSYEKYLSLLDKKREEYYHYVVREINNCYTAKKIKKRNYTIKKVKLGPYILFGEKNKSFVLVSADQMVSVFSYGKYNYTFGNINYELNTENYKTDNIYFSKKVNGVWQGPINITKDLKIKHQAFPVSMTSDGKTLFIVQDDNDDGNIYISHYINEKWTPIKKLNRNINSKQWEIHANITSDGKKLYFVSNRKGGKGGFDIYYSELNKNGKWGKAINLGNNINTTYDEDLPFISADNTRLYFCSQGHENIGGYDIFKSEIINGQFQKAENIGFALNSPRNDFFYVTNVENKFIFSRLAIDENIIITKKPETITVRGEITTKINANLPEKFTIKADSLISNIQVNGKTFTFNSQKQNINFVIIAEGFIDKPINIDLSNYDKDTKEITVEIEPIPVIVDNNIANTNDDNEFKNQNSSSENFNKFVLFDFNSSKIKNEYTRYLDYIANNSLDKTIEIYAYADKKGSKVYNKNLSRKRALAVKTYLINKKVSDSKVVVIPKGETSKFGTDSLNRRAEIKFTNSSHSHKNNKTVLFNFDDYSLSKNAKLLIDDIIENITKESIITVVAYTDPIGDTTYNKYLSIKRANSVKKYIISKGISENRIIAQGKGILQANIENYLKRKAEIIIK